MTSRHLRPSAITLIATLGSEPQVVTAALDLLLRQGEKVRQVRVLHSVAPSGPIASAVEALSTEFVSPVKGARLELVPILDGDRPVADVETPQASAAAFQALYRLVRQAKQAGEKVHLCIAGGRKNLAIFGLVAAQMLFDDQDRLWHLYSAGEFLASKRLHPGLGDDVHLLPIPVLLRSYISPALTDLRGVEDAQAAVEHLQRLAIEEKLAQARAFVLGSLSGAERRAVELLVREGLSDQAISRRLSVSPRTVEQQLRSAYARAADHWGLPTVKRTLLVSLLSLYYSLAAPAGQE